MPSWRTPRAYPALASKAPLTIRSPACLACSRALHRTHPQPHRSAGSTSSHATGAPHRRTPWLTALTDCLPLTPSLLEISQAPPPSRPRKPPAKHRPWPPQVRPSVAHVQRLVLSGCGTADNCSWLGLPPKMMHATAAVAPAQVGAWLYFLLLKCLTKLSVPLHDDTDLPTRVPSQSPTRLPTGRC